VYYVQSQCAISVLAAPDDILLAQKILADLDRTKKTYRLTYTITETDNGKLVAARHFSLIVVSDKEQCSNKAAGCPSSLGQPNPEAQRKAPGAICRCGDEY